MNCKRVLSRWVIQSVSSVVGATLMLWLSTSSQEVSTAASANDAAYSLITQRVAANQAGFHVYEDADSGFNHGVPSGFFGSISSINLDAACVNDPDSPNGCSTDPNRLDRERGTTLRISFASLSPGTFAGVNIEEPENHGAQPRGNGYDLRGATQIAFDVRSPGGVRVRFGVGGCVTTFMTLPASSSYTRMSIPISSLNCQPDLANAHILFTVVTDASNAPNGGTVLLDNIRFEPVPTNQRSALGFPLSTQTFGVAPRQTPAQGRVPIPSDQVLRNLASTYESALALLALLERGSNQDLINARLIADTFVYALSHDNQGGRLPAAPDGAAGLHNGYESGDVALLNDQGPGAGQAGNVRLAGFSAGTQLCGPSGFCLLLDGGSGGNNAFAILSLVAAHKRLGEQRYLDAARIIDRWIVGNLTDTANTGYGGYYLGYRDTSNPKELITGKSVESNAAIFAAFMTLAAIERQLNNDSQAAQWTGRANVAGDFVIEMFDGATGCFRAGTVPVGIPPGPGIKPDGPRRGNDVINTFDFLDANALPALALAAAPRYRDRIDWRRPVQCVLGKFAQSVTVGGQAFRGFSLVTRPTAGPNGVAWEFTGETVAMMRFIDRLYEESGFKQSADLYLNEIRQAQTKAPFTDSQGLVAGTLQDGDRLPPIEQCLSTPFQCIPQRVGIAATAWAIFADRGINPLDAATLSATTAVSVSAASYRGMELASEVITAAFGVNLATTTQAATMIPLPTSLAGTRVRVKDSANVERLAPLFFVSSNQVNYQIPPGTAIGPAKVTITNENGSAAAGVIQIVTVAPGLFAANATGQGVAAGVALRVKANGMQVFEPVAQFDQAQGRFIAVPIDLGPEGEQVFLIPFGTGFRNRSSLSAVMANVGGVNAEVLFAGAAPGFVGLDQANLRIPRSLAGRGDVDVALTVDGKAANPVRVNIK